MPQHDPVLVLIGAEGEEGDKDRKKRSIASIASRDTCIVLQAGLRTREWVLTRLITFPRHAQWHID